MTKTCKILGLLLLLLSITSLCLAAEEKVLVNTYFPAPSLKYDQVTTENLVSQSTDVTGEFKKDIAGTANSLRIANTPTPVSSYPSGGTYSSFIGTPVYFSSFEQNKSLQIIPPPGSTAATIGLNVYNMKVNAIRDLSSLSVGGNLINAWPGPGQCQNFSNFFVFTYTASCPDNSYLDDISETAGFYVGAGVGGGTATAGLGLGGGVKMATVNYRCCTIAGTNASLTGSTTTSACQAAYNAYNTANNNWKTAQQQIVTKFSQMTSSGCCNSGTLYQEVLPDGTYIYCNYDPTPAQCPPLFAQYQSLVSTRDNTYYPVVATTKTTLCNCICNGDASCFNACFKGN